MTLSDSPVQKTVAWAVHLFTATGVVLAALALLSIVNDNPVACIFWLAVSLIIDGIDGTLARKFNVKNILPQVDGSVLDLITDYLTYVFIPVLFMYYYVPFPENTTLFILGCILISSLYCFSNIGMKSTDNYFVGFPATWNIVALYFYLLDMGFWFNLIVCLVLCVLTFSKIKFLHPFRVKELMPLNILATGIWFATSLILANDHISTGGNDIVWILWWVSSLYIFVVCLWRTWFKNNNQ
ncbi:MAG: phosphatidylcholine/phosphatidylserine synthase [Neisseriaceae bacterium]|nr:MAG: phosphatidylcholine/phosphatidylserine synthase [Neisseriaceae bacterium]